MIAAAGGYHAYLHNSAATEDGDMLMANVEALAGGTESSQPVTCYNTITEAEDETCYYCPKCLFMEDSDRALFSTSDKCNP